MWHALIETEDDVATLILRVLLGVVMFPHGAQKMLGWWGGAGFSGTLDAFAGMGIPTVLAFLVILGELFGALGLIVGFLTRIAAAGIGIIIATAAALVHVQHGFFMNWYGNQSGEGFEYHLLVVAIALALVLRGGGKASLDGWLFDRALQARH